MKKLILFMLVLFMIPFTYGDEYLNAHGRTLATPGAWSSMFGMNITADDTGLTLRNVVLATGVTATDCVLYDQVEGSVLSETTAVLNNCTFNYALTQGEDYFIGYWSGGASYNNQYENHNGWPYIKQNITFNDQYYNNSGTWTRHIGDTRGIFAIGISYNLPAPEIDQINISNTLPGNNAQFGLDTISINTSINISQLTQCNLLINNTINKSYNYSVGTDILINHNITFIDGEYNLKFNCFNNTISENSSTNTFYVDTVQPYLYVNYQQGNTQIGNNLLSLYKNDSNYLNVTVADDNLYSLNISTSWGFTDYITLLGNTTYQYNLSLYPDNKTNDTVHNIYAEVCDGHTKEEIKDYKIKKDAYSIEYDGIKIKSKDITTDIVTVKYKDKYSFTFKYDTPKYSIDLEVPTECEYIDSNKYKGWFVCYGSKKWIDFEGDYDVKVTDNKIKITSDVALTDWTFNSIGSLNCQNTTYYWYRPQVYYYSYTNTLPEAYNRNYNVSIYYNTSWINSTQGILQIGSLNTTGVNLYSINTSTHRNDTIRVQYSMPNQNASQVNYSVNWWLTLYGNTGVYNYTFDDYYNNVTVNRVDLALCGGAYNVTAINFTVKSELNSTDLVNVDVEAFITAYFGDIATERESGFTITSTNNYALCVAEAVPDFQVSTIIRHTNTSYRTEDYIQRYYTITGSHANLTVWLLIDDTNDYDVLRDIRDLQGQYYRNYLIEGYKYDVVNNTFRLVETKLSDWNGQAVLTLDILDELYIFKIYDEEGGLIYQTSLMEIVDEDDTFFISNPQASAKLGDYLTAKAGSVSLSRSGNDITATYSLSNSENTCLKVSIWNATGKNLLSTQCSTDTSDTITYTTSNGTITAEVVAQYSNDNFTISTDDYVIINEENKNFKLTVGGVIVLMLGIMGFTLNLGVGLIGVIVGLVVVSVAGLIPLQATAIFGAVILTGVLVFARKRGANNGA